MNKGVMQKKVTSKVSEHIIDISHLYGTQMTNSNSCGRACILATTCSQKGFQFGYRHNFLV